MNTLVETQTNDLLLTNHFRTQKMLYREHYELFATLQNSSNENIFSRT